MVVFLSRREETVGDQLSTSSPELTPHPPSAHDLDWWSARHFDAGHTPELDVFVISICYLRTRVEMGEDRLNRGLSIGTFGVDKKGSCVERQHLPFASEIEKASRNKSAMV